MKFCLSFLPAMSRDEMDTCKVHFNEDIEVYDQHIFEEDNVILL